VSRFLANENVPAEAVELARHHGLDVAWVREVNPGADDETVLASSVAEGRVLVTFDKDFGEMAFRQLRPRLRSPEYLAQFALATLTQTITWEGLFCVAREGQARVVPLPE
jgi:hypothetical protein